MLMLTQDGSLIVVGFVKNVCSQVKVFQRNGEFIIIQKEQLDILGNRLMCFLAEKKIDITR